MPDGKLIWGVSVSIRKLEEANAKRVLDESNLEQLRIAAGLISLWKWLISIGIGKDQQLSSCLQQLSGSFLYVSSQAVAKRNLIKQQVVFSSATFTLMLTCMRGIFHSFLTEDLQGISLLVLSVYLLCFLFSSHVICVRLMPCFHTLLCVCNYIKGVCQLKEMYSFRDG